MSYIYHYYHTLKLFITSMTS